MVWSHWNAGIYGSPLQEISTQLASYKRHVFNQFYESEEEFEKARAAITFSEQFRDDFDQKGVYKSNINVLN
jgi:hypothetical protein